MIWQIFFLFVVMAVQVGLMMACFLLSNYLLNFVSLPHFWRELFGLSLPIFFYALVFAAFILIQAEYDTYRRNKKRPPN